MPHPHRLGPIFAASLLSFALVSTPAQASPEAQGKETIDLDLYTLTDVHGHIEQVTKKGKVTEAGGGAMKCYLDKARDANPNSSLMLLGDNIGASPFTSGILKDNPTVEVLNKLDPVASTLGNHELDLGVRAFQDRLSGKGGFSKVGFQYLAINVEGIQGLGKYKIWTSPSGIKVAYIGAIAADVPAKLNPAETKNLRFNDPIPLLNQTAKKLKEDGQADVVVAALDDDTKNNYRKMDAAYVDGFMGGDTHVPYTFSKDEGEPVSAVASGSYMDNLGVLRLKIDSKTKKITSSKAQLIPAGTIAQCGSDQGVQQIIDSAAAQAKDEGEKPVATGVKGKYLRGVHLGEDGQPIPGANRGVESTLGDMIADSLKDEVFTDSEGKQKVDIGVIHAGDLREDLIPNQGVITYAQTFVVEPFSNDIGYRKMSGATFKTLLEQQWKLNNASEEEMAAAGVPESEWHNQGSRPMLKLNLSSNVSYTYDPEAPYGKHITSVSIDGKPLEVDKTYTVGSVKFLLDGGDSFAAMRDGSPIRTLGVLDRDSVNNYLKNHAGELSPRSKKASVGIRLVSEQIDSNGDLTFELQGLSFTEGPGITKRVSVRVGDHEASGKVDNSLAETERVRTDGAGKATVKVHVGAVEKPQSLPLSVKTDFGEVVSPAQGLKVQIRPAAGEAKPTEPSQDKPANESGTPGKAGHDVPEKASKASKKAGHLAATGSNGQAELALSALLLIGGACVLTARRRNRSC